MSSVRSSEPQANGLIILKTTFGELEVELFTQQCPKATRNFVQLCLDGYYNETVFDRVERDFIAVGGALQDDEPDDRRDKAGTFKDEFHPRLRFTRRGLMATANTQKDSNGPEFFFTLGPTPELQDKHTIFGRLKGDSVYYLVDLNDTQVDEDLVPISEKMILETHVIENPYPDLEPRKGFTRVVGLGKTVADEDDLKPKFNLNKKLSFKHDESDDDEEDEEEEEEEEEEKGGEGDEQVDVKPARDLAATKTPEDCMTSQIKEEKHQKTESANNEVDTGTCKQEKSETNDDENPREKRLREIRAQIQQLKKQFESEPTDTKPMKASERRAQSNKTDSDQDLSSSIDTSKRSASDVDQSNSSSRIVMKKSRKSERETLEILENFKKKLKEPSLSSSKNQDVKASRPINEDLLDEDDGLGVNLNDLDKVDGDAWLGHRFEADEDEVRLAKDANTKDDNWYSIEDPRNPVKRRVEEEKSDNYHKRSSSSTHHRRDHRDYREDRREHRDHRDKRGKDRDDSRHSSSRHHHSRRA